MKNRAWLFTLALSAGCACMLASARAPSAQPEAQYAGSETCKGCHAALWEAFQTSVHGRVEKDGAVVADQVGCESCHGPGSLHAGAGGDKDDPGFTSIHRLKTMKPGAASEICLGCHKGGEQFYWEHGAHARNDVSCVKCHSIHHAKTEPGGPMLTAATATEMCVGCHKSQKLAMQRSAHMPLREGGMTCVNCHNSHGSAGPRQIRAGNVNDLCYKCHMDKRGPFLWEHAPVSENCLNCHRPHGSSNARVPKMPYLCQRCHVASRHPSTLYDRADLVSNRLVNRSCTNCHAAIHGSNHPSGEYFLR
jgi:DmsE family decaheme c-type cytochrome